MSRKVRILKMPNLVRVNVRLMWHKSGTVHCTYCGVKLSKKTTTVDHVLPLCRGGTNDFSNLTPSCFDCNNKKGELPVYEFEKLRAAEIGRDGGEGT